MPDHQLLAVLLVVLSPAVGSFLAVLVERLPNGADVVRAPSRCAACCTRLTWSEMIPILSYVAQRGRCRTCAAPIPGHLPRIEALALAAAMGAALAGDTPLRMGLIAAVLWCLIALFYTDLLRFRLPDALTAALLLAGLALGLSDPARPALEPVLSALGASAAFWLLGMSYRALRGRDGLGAGDVKLMAGIGAAVGWQEVPLVTLMAALLALTVAGLQALRDKTAPQRFQAVPFGSFLTAAAAVFLIF